jgi:hypothetical protein
MNKRNVSRILAWGTLCFVFVYGAQLGAVTDVRKMLPPQSAGSEWRLVGDNYTYLPDTLYNYINGAADLFISYGFVALTGGEYRRGSDERENVTVDVYDMGSTLNAFGVFQSKRDPEVRSLTIGAGAFGTEKYVFFYKGRFYVEIQAYVLSSTTSDVVMKMAQQVDQSIGEDSAPPSELRYLPDDNRVAGSEMYITGGILGHGFLDRGLLCDYTIGGETVKAFVVFFSSGALAVKALDHYKSYLERSGEKWQVINGLGENGFASQEPYHKQILVAQQGAFVAGVADLSQSSKGEELLKRILRTIQKP